MYVIIFLTIAVSNDCTFITVPTETACYIYDGYFKTFALGRAIIDCFKIESIQLYKEDNNIVLLFKHSIRLHIRVMYFDTF